MSDTTPAVTGAPLAENEYVKDLFAILTENGRDAGGLAAIIGHVGEMESFVKRAEDTIADMKSQLDSISEIQNHPIRAALQKTIKALEAKVTEVRQQIKDLKADIIEGCKSAVAAFRESGVTALDNIASFLHIRQGLQSMKNSLVADMSRCDKSIAEIKSFAQEYHTAGRAVKNMARIAVGKKPLDARKEAGRLSKLVSAPYKAHKVILSKLKITVDKALGGLTQLETSALQKHAERERERRPSLLEKLAANKERAARERRETPTPERAVTQGIDV